MVNTINGQGSLVILHCTRESVWHLGLAIAFFYMKGGRSIPFFLVGIFSATPRSQAFSSWVYGPRAGIYHIVVVPVSLCGLIEELEG